MLLLWPENVNDVIFFCAMGAAMMFMLAHRNGHILRDQPIVAWILGLLAVPLPFIVTAYFLTTSDRVVLHDASFRLVMIFLSVLVATGLLAWIRQRAGNHSRLARLLRIIDPCREPGR